jgi:hypothetical protein
MLIKEHVNRLSGKAAAAGICETKHVGPAASASRIRYEKR